MRKCPIYKQNQKEGSKQYLNNTLISPEKRKKRIQNAIQAKIKKSKTRKYKLYGNGCGRKSIELDVSVEYVDNYRKAHPVCEICGKPERIKNNGKTTSKLAVDHNHKTNKFRGVLCCDCNRKLGWFENLREEVLNYLDTH